MATKQLYIDVHTKGAKEAQKELGAINKSLADNPKKSKTAKEEVAKYGKEATKAAKSTKSLSKAVTKNTKDFSGLKKAIGGAVLGIAGGAAFKGLAGAALSSGAALEQTVLKFDKMTGAGEETVKVLQDFANVTPFVTDEVVKAGQTLVTFDKTLRGNQEALKDALADVGDAAALAGAPIGELAEVYGKVIAEGKLTKETFIQLASRGIDMGGAIEEATGKSGEGMFKMISAGEITSEKFKEIFSKMNDGAGSTSGAMTDLSQTFGGAVSTIQGVWGNMVAEFGRSIVQKITPFLLRIGKVLTELSPFWKKFAVGAVLGVAALVALTGAAIAFNLAMSPISAAVIATGLAVGGLVAAVILVRKYADVVIDRFWGLSKAGKAIVVAIGFIFAPVTLAIGAFVGLVKIGGYVIANFLEIIAKIKHVGRVISGFVGNIFSETKRQEAYTASAKKLSAELGSIADKRAAKEMALANKTELAEMRKQQAKQGTVEKTKELEKELTDAQKNAIDEREKLDDKARGSFERALKEMKETWNNAQASMLHKTDSAVKAMKAGYEQFAAVAFSVFSGITQNKIDALDREKAQQDKHFDKETEARLEQADLQKEERLSAFEAREEEEMSKFEVQAERLQSEKDVLQAQIETASDAEKETLKSKLSDIIEEEKLATNQRKLVVAELGAEKERVERELATNLDTLNKDIEAEKERREDEYKKKKNELAKKAFKADKANRVAQTVISGAQAVVSALTLLPPAGQILAGIVAALTVGQLAVIEGQRYTPELRAGGVVMGSGTGTSDSIEARISSGEAVIDAERTRRLISSIDATTSNSNSINITIEAGAIQGLDLDDDFIDMVGRRLGEEVRTAL